MIRRAACNASIGTGHRLLRGGLPFLAAMFLSDGTPHTRRFNTARVGVGDLRRATCHGAVGRSTTTKQLADGDDRRRGNCQLIAVSVKPI